MDAREFISSFLSWRLITFQRERKHGRELIGKMSCRDGASGRGIETRSFNKGFEYLMWEELLEVEWGKKGKRTED